MWRVLLVVFVCFSSTAYAGDGLTLFSLADGDKTQSVNVKLEILALMTVLSFLPALLMMLTSFTRIIVVLAILRQALGLQQSPPNKVLIGIALVMTIFIMRPVGQAIYDEAFLPYDLGQIELTEAVDRGEKPLRAFMLAQTRETDLEQMLKIADEPTTLTTEQIPFFVLMPAFVLSELKTAFQIGFLLFLPFLVIDLVVASVLMSMGMMMLSPLIISLPFKLMVFVLVDGWSMTVSTLVASYG
ncbi:flagellar biosynthetic protein FliP [Shewanella sp. Choline-02u-19]|jgi:flagellar biosynthetic protein FliP|uniref:flagellar type III secretion system pore protein FliP n=1 Tax=unclassified Shewanella TaxID=196818 RepID=UPI000C324E63|nr:MULTISPECIES: flagellar type III secretion system pore protein FliP [unclassified Shewanella]PKG58870.1 flagellar biosynthetic protein FliP [Shewanella sp. GutDb-MelDb]PKH57250.1 flagellar biosynthetic protein FliP [Shewanella sp. Bg11-22]PKI29636.1 flagellar biosynthetic protein FliP [Shewanella sp. Choline-02u-19]